MQNRRNPPGQRTPTAASLSARLCRPEKCLFYSHIAYHSGFSEQNVVKLSWLRRTCVTCIGSGTSHSEGQSFSGGIFQKYKSSDANLFERRRGTRLRDQNKIRRFEERVLPHLDAAYNLARWLTRNDLDAEDVVQESYLRAFKFFERLRVPDSRPWLLAIVRNVSYTLIQRRRVAEEELSFDEEMHSPDPEKQDPEVLLLQRMNQQVLKEAIEALPLEFREVLVLRELEGLSYKEISDITAVPLGTVMSRLARARKKLQASVARSMNKELSGEL